MKTVHKIRMSLSDAHYAGQLVDGARILALFGDAATELCIIDSGVEGLFRAYEKIEFLHPVYAGDFLEIRAEILSKGNRSRQMSFEAYKIIESTRNIQKPEEAHVLNPPILVTKALGTCVI